MKTEQAADKQLLFVKWLDSDEGAALVALSGVRVESVGGDGMVFDGDVLLRFWLPAGGCVEYTAEMESDYYGGEYTKIKWSLWA